MEHYLKILPVYFKAVKEGNKTFEIRKHDRDFNVGDTLVLNEYKSLEKYGVATYTGQEITKEVSYILEGGQHGLEEGYCILGLKNTEPQDVKTDKEKQEFNLGDTAFMIDDDYRFFESEVYKIELDNGKYYYIADDIDFEFKDIGNWVFKSELSREVYLRSIN